MAEILAGLPGRVRHILHWRHAEEHRWAVAPACLGEDALAWIPAPRAALRKGRVDALVGGLRASYLSGRWQQVEDLACAGQHY